MKKALTLQLNRTPTGEEVKDGGPALVSEVINALKRKGYAVDSVSGNTMKGVKQYSTGSAFEQRILKARDFAAQIKSDLYEPYDLILMFHPSTAFAFEKENMPPIDKAVMFPTLLGKEYSYFNPGVADEYIEMERRMFSFGHYVQSPSHAQAQILTDVYDVAEERILVRPRGFSPKLFPPQVRTLRSDVSPEKPLTIFCANAVRPQKGHLHFVELARE